MTDDLVKRLRDNCSCNFPDTPCGAEEQCRNAFEAADRIEKLEVALREVLSLGEWGVNPLARTVILEALESKCEQLEEGA
jgi:hypothetical protein